MGPPSTLTASEKTTKGGLVAQERGYTLSDVHKLRSLLLSRGNNREKFWSHAFQGPDLPVICCGDQDIQVQINICHENCRDLRTEIVSQEGHFHQILSDECRASPALFVFIDSREHGSGKLSLTWPMLRELVTSLQIMPQFSDHLPWKTNHQRSRGATIAGFASSKDNGLGEICLSLYHCWNQQSRPGEKFKVSVARAIFYAQAHKERVRWIMIGRPVVGDLHTVYLDTALPEPHSLDPTFIIFIATIGWQISLNSMEDDLITELKTARYATGDPNYSRFSGLVDALSGLQGQILNAKWQIEANISVLRSFAEIHASRGFHNLASNNVDKITAALIELSRGAARADHLTCQVQNAIKQATRVAAHAHATNMETLSWHNLKLIHAVEYRTNQTTVIFALLALAIFTSTFFSTNFFSLSADGSILQSQWVWIWFATTVPLTVLFLVLVRFWNKRRTQP